MELLFAERLKKHRLAAKLTQEQLGDAIGISSKSVSKWERGEGYPDITLLPRIANFFKITVDELIGNDEATVEDDVNDFCGKYFKFSSSKEGLRQRLTLAKEYYAKYPQNYEVMHWLGDAIVNNMDCLEENRALLTEIHEKIMQGCTEEEYRRDSMHRMCYAAPDEALEDQIGKSELNWQEAVPISELREERYLLAHRYDQYRRQRNATDLLIFMQYLGRSNMSYYGAENGYVFEEAERTAAWEMHKTRLLEQFDAECTEANGVPEAWCGCYAEFSLKASGALIASGKINDRFALLDKTFGLYERWIKIPPGKKMDVGNHTVFGGATVSKAGENHRVDIHFPDGFSEWTPYLWLFWQLKGDILWALTKWSWFEKVKDDPRYLDALERAKKMAEKA